MKTEVEYYIEELADARAEIESLKATLNGQNETHSGQDDTRSGTKLEQTAEMAPERGRETAPPGVMEYQKLQNTIQELNTATFGPMKHIDSEGRELLRSVSKAHATRPTDSHLQTEPESANSCDQGDYDSLLSDKIEDEKEFMNDRRILNNRIAELEAERDELKRQVAGWEQERTELYGELIGQEHCLGTAKEMAELQRDRLLQLVLEIKERMEREAAYLDQIDNDWLERARKEVGS